MNIYFKGNFAGNENYTLQFDLVGVSDASAESPKKLLLGCLKSHGISEDFLTDIFVFLVSDDASAMLG